MTTIKAQISQEKFMKYYQKLILFGPFAPLFSLHCKSVLSEDTENGRSLKVKLQFNTSHTIKFSSFLSKRFTIDHAQLFLGPCSSVPLISLRVEISYLLSLFRQRRDIKLRRSSPQVSVIFDNFKQTYIWKILVKITNINFQENTQL